MYRRQNAHWGIAQIIIGVSASLAVSVSPATKRLMLLQLRRQTLAKSLYAVCLTYICLHKACGSLESIVGGCSDPHALNQGNGALWLHKVHQTHCVGWLRTIWMSDENEACSQPQVVEDVADLTGQTAAPFTTALKSLPLTCQATEPGFSDILRNPGSCRRTLAT